MSMIFLSYSRKDIDTMYRVKQRLTQAGVTVWTDENLTPGTPAWTREIERNLHGCAAVVVMMSPTAKESRWVLRECTKAQQKGKPIFPLLIKGNPEDHIPLELCDIQYIDLRRNFDGGLKQLIGVFVARGWCKQMQKEVVFREPQVVKNGDLVKKNAKFHFDRGVLHHNAGRYSKAIMEFTQALDSNSQNVDYLNGRGLSFHKSGQYEKAIIDYSKAIELDPLDAYCYYCRGVSYHELGLYDKANADYTKAIELESQKPIYYNARGVNRHSSGEYANAIMDFTKVINLEPENPFYHYQRGNSFQRIRQYAEAVADFSNAIALVPKNAEYYFSRGTSFYESGLYSEAIEDFTKAIELEPQNGEYYDCRADCYYALGDEEKGLDDMVGARIWVERQEVLYN